MVKNQLHTAIQLVSIPPRSYSPQSENDHFARLTWDGKRKAFVSQNFGELKNIQTALNVDKFELEIIVEEIVFDAINLDNRSFQLLFDWISNKLNRLQLDPDILSSKFPYELNDIEIVPDIKIINYDPPTLSEFCKYYQNAHFSLKNFASENLKKKVNIGIWPHHFDLAVEYSLSDDKPVIISMGLSPGDQYYPEPYFYLSFPEKIQNDIINRLKPIVGTWHTKQWWGLVLPASEFILETEHLQERIVIDFLKNAYDISKKVYP